MFAQNYLDYYKKTPQYKTAPVMDAVLPCRFRNRKLTGVVDEMARFIEDFQLLDTGKWELFVSQFVNGNVDSDDRGWRGEYWGKLMRGACITYIYTRNPKLYDVLTKTVLAMLSTQDALGRFSTYRVEKEYDGWDIWGRKYILLGMLHYHEICEDEALKARIITAMEAHLDYMVNTLGDGKKPINQTSNFWGSANSVSVLEPVMRMYNQTGKQSYLDFAHYIVKTGPENLNIFEEAYRNETAPYQWEIPKAYELMSCFEGLLEYYRVTGIEKWKIAAENFAKKIIDTDVSIIGCCGCNYECFDNCNRTQTNVANLRPVQETCVTVTWMKLCYQLLRLTGDVIYADEIEKSVYNGLYGAVNTEKSANNGGLPFDSYSPLMLNKRGREIGGDQYDENKKLIYGCCAAIGAAGTGIVPEVAAGATKEGIVFNLYVNGTYGFTTPANKELTVEVATRYPVDGAVALKLMPEADETFQLKLRIPEFSVNTVLMVNGEAVAVEGRYANIDRCWKPGDIVALTIDMAPRVLHPVGCGTEESLRFVAVKYGPVVLARDARVCPDAGQPVDLAYDENDRIAITPADKPAIPTLCQFAVPCKNGSTTLMVDYQSCGRTWDMESATEAWLPVAP